MPLLVCVADDDQAPHVGSGTTGGAGLGLSIALGIAEAHGGTLLLDPTTPAPRSWSRCPPRRRRALKTTATMSSATRVLLIEDDQNIVDLVRSNLTVRGHDGLTDMHVDATQRVSAGNVEIDLDAQAVTKGGRRVHLTRTEFALLGALARHPGTLLTHATLLREVWGPGYETQTEYTRVYVRRLRAKLEDDDSEPLIITEPRAGYRLQSSAHG